MPHAPRDCQGSDPRKPRTRTKSQLEWGSDPEGSNDSPLSLDDLENVLLEQGPLFVGTEIPQVRPHPLESSVDVSLPILKELSLRLIPLRVVTCGRILPACPRFVLRSSKSLGCLCPLEAFQHGRFHLFHPVVQVGFQGLGAIADRRVADPVAEFPGIGG